MHAHEARLHPGYFRGRQHIAAITVVGLLALVAFRLFPAQDVIVLNNGRAVHVRATFDAQDEALERARVELGQNDRVVQAQGGGHLSVAVQRARPVTIQADGDTLLLKTQAETVAGALAAAGIEIQ
ncbi:MAG: ubiquitin-like domain-containing protein [Dehalococcoidia bacterium]|nr:ubiquitin-like domain-containing protein [Dehalococcoidia bacterium]